MCCSGRKCKEPDISRWKRQFVFQKHIEPSDLLQLYIWRSYLFTTKVVNWNVCLKSMSGKQKKSFTRNNCFHLSASLVMPNSDPRDGLVYPHLTHMKDTKHTSPKTSIPRLFRTRSWVPRNFFHYWRYNNRNGIIWDRLYYLENVCCMNS